MTNTTNTYYVVQNTQTGEYLRRYALGHKKLYSSEVNSNTFRGKKPGTVNRYLETIKSHLVTLGREAEAHLLQVVSVELNTASETNAETTAQVVNS